MMAREESTGEHNHLSMHAALVDVDDGQGGSTGEHNHLSLCMLYWLMWMIAKGGIYRRAQQSISACCIG